MEDEGRKQKLIAIKAWQIKFSNELEEKFKELERFRTTPGIGLSELGYGKRDVIQEILGEN